MSSTHRDFVGQESPTQPSAEKKAPPKVPARRVKIDGQFRLTPEARRHVRSAVNIPVLLTKDKDAIACHTLDISPGGLRILGEAPISVGAPLDLKFCFGEVCYLHISGRAVFCSTASETPKHSIGVAFSAIRDWEQIVLLSALKELGESAPTREKSLVTVAVSNDGYAVAASKLSGPDELSQITSPTLSPQPLDSLTSQARTGEASENLGGWPATLGIDESTTAALVALQPSLDVPTYTLLLNGEDVDTGLYKFCFYADKLISAHRAVLHTLKELKRGRVPAEAKDFIFARYCVGKKETNQVAMRAAYAASKEYRFFPLEKRIRIAADIHDLLLAQKNELIELMVREGHPVRLAEWEFSGMEQAYRRDSLDFYGQHLKARIGSHGHESLYLVRKPDGVLGVCPPRNAPCSSSLIAGFGLLAGNTLIVKPPLRMPVSTIFLWKNIVQKALTINQAPPGTLNIVVGNSSSILDEWITERYVNDLLFIGDSLTGLDVGRRAFEWGKKPILELSGNDMMFIWKDADLNQSVQSLLDGFMGSTQICMVPKKAFIHEDIYPAFEAKFLEGAKSLKVGLPSNPDVFLSPVAKLGQFYEFLADALGRGAELLCGGIRVNHTGTPDQAGAFITPSVLRVSEEARAHDMKCVREENFFPLIPLIKVSGDVGGNEHDRDVSIFKKMIVSANSNAYGLRVSVWVNSPEFTEKFMEHVHNSGLIRVNCRHVGFSPRLATHGGTGKSGGPFGELNYVWQKTSHLQGIALTRINQSLE